jgi:hypothetical protein
VKKLLIIVALGVVGLVSLFVIRGNDAEAGRFDLLEHYKCYQARHAKRSPRFVPTTIFLSDQFEHNKETRVTSLSMFCALADQQIQYDGVSVASDQTDLTCYTIKDAPRQPRFVRQDIAVRDKLTDWTDQVLTSSKAESFCTPAQKLGKGGGSTAGAPIFEQGYKCYSARTAKRQPRFQQLTVGISDLFGEKEARVLRPTAYCSLVEKKLAAFNDDIDNANDDVAGGLNNYGYFEDHISTTLATLQNNSEFRDPIISCKVDYSHSVWYRWQKGDNLSLIINTEGSTYDTVVAVFEDNDPSDDVDLKEVACNDDTEKECNVIFFGVEDAGQPCCLSGTAGGRCEELEPNPWSTVQFNAFEDEVYYILVGSSEGRGGKLKFFVEAKEDAADACQNKIGINTLYYQYDFTELHYSTLNATEIFNSGNKCGGDDPSLSCTSGGGNNYSNSVYFTYLSANEFQKIEFNASDSDYETVVAILDESFDVLACGLGSAQYTMEPNTKYQVMVGDVSDDRLGGKLKMTVTHLGGLPPNPDGVSAGVGQQGVPDSLTCYDVRQARHRAENRKVEDQFSFLQLRLPTIDGQSAGNGENWLLSIGSVKRFCVPSNKITCTGNSNNHAGDVDAAELCYD